MNFIATLGIVILPLLMLFFGARYLGRQLKERTSLTFQTIFYGVFVLCLLLLISWNGRNLKYSKQDLIEVTGEVASIKFTSAVRGGSTLHITLVDQPWDYRTDDFSHHVLKEAEFKNEISKGDSLTLSYSKNDGFDYRPWLARQNGIIHVVGIRTDQKEYASIEDYNTYREEDYPFMYLLWLLPVAVYIYWFTKRKQGQDPWAKRKEET